MGADHSSTKHRSRSVMFYSYFAGYGRDDLAAAFASADPFALSPAAIVEQVIVLGCIPLPKQAMWPTVGQVFEVRREEQDFLVSISRDAEEISVQEFRADAYDTLA